MPIKEKICVIGLGYVGLPLLVELIREGFDVIGYDKSKKRIDELNSQIDSNDDIEKTDLYLLGDCEITADESRIAGCSVFIVAVPTPVDQNLVPDLTSLCSATELVGRAMIGGSVVVYESTVFPGCSEEICLPILENVSGLKHIIDFAIGFSPERIVPGDKVNTIRKIKKITSATTEWAHQRLINIYGKIIDAGVVPVSSIMVAEMSKIIENTQRDINIALVNEIAIICNKLGIKTKDVLDAAGTKWNFLPFKPGLVGGHCIGVDPYYLTYKAQGLGYHPEVILAGRRINDKMSEYVVANVIKHLISKNASDVSRKILLMGATFKENCKDVRNSKAIDIYRYIKNYGLEVQVYDPLADSEILVDGINIYNKFPECKFDVVIVAVAHDEFCKLTIDDFAKVVVPGGLIYDVKSIYTDRTDLAEKYLVQGL